ncbi:ATP-binding cassette sub-family G member 1 [Condylostylus longicornis]|uniref:ATP-binding cassette sub-family G member 1 n=1 Tax=Condylostylus longicornis TaxID=2530218 RepID=UPI00244DC52A|nr:ATP-binding cassette sub-family G member 1 [Condylostylus longicornis]XP_055378441.1 ATP-binding cassette sub-family G member 1 [Condylostylus longicornis]
MDLTETINKSKDVEFQDIYYSVSERKNNLNIIKQAATRNILKGVSGVFRNGQFTAIMGQSGAGKSSLLNAISGFTTSGVTGHIKINRKNSCYITQEDHHQTLLTVEELMHISCALKLNTPRNTHKQVITEILENLSLNHRRDVTADLLSGGERKRLSIALELVSDPKIFFLDEPTSGLDEVTAAQCCRLLKMMAKQGRTIVCTIHQPSSTIFSLFDSVFILGKGLCVYQGGPNSIISFLSQINLICPKTYSPLDYIIEICDSDDGMYIPKLAELTQNGKLIYCTKELPATVSSEIEIGIQNNDDLIPMVEYKNAVTTLFIEQQQSNRPKTFNCFYHTSVLFEKMKSLTKWMRPDYTHPISSFKQFGILYTAMMTKILRNRIALWIQLIHHIMCGLFFGMIFYNANNQGERMFDHLKFCIGCVLVICYTQVMVPVLSFPFEVKLVKKEFFNRWYTLPPYYVALNLSRIPFQLLFNMIFLTLTYWMAGLPNQIWRFFIYSGVGIITSFVAEGMGLFIGATCKVTNGAVVAPLTIAPLLGLAIYGFDFAASIPAVLNLIMKFSYIRVSVVAFVLIVFGFDRPNLDCNDIYCHFGDPKVLLRFLDIEHVSIWTQFGLLTLLMVFFRTLLFISLKKRCRT